MKEFNTNGYYLGRLCKRGHDHNGTGKSLRRKNCHCVECDRERYQTKEYKEKKRVYDSTHKEEKSRARKLWLKTESGRLSFNRSMRKYHKKNPEKFAKLQRDYYKNNKEKVTATIKRWAEKNQDKIKEQGKRYRIKNREKINARKRQYRKEHPEQERAKKKRYLEKYPEKEKARRMLYRKTHRGIINAQKARRRAKKLNATPVYANRKAIKRIYRTASILSKMLGRKFEVDHIIPLNSDLVCGLHHQDNLQILSAERNNRKSNKFDPIIK